jgi:hypothetical protein
MSELGKRAIKHENSLCVLLDVAVSLTISGVCQPCDALLLLRACGAGLIAWLWLGLLSR